MRKLTKLLPCLFLLITISTINGSGQEMGEAYTHPLDPLDSTEMKTVQAILMDEGKLDTSKIEYIGEMYLHEPDKNMVLNYEEGDDYNREAFATVYNYPENKLYEAIVDLNENELVSYKHIPDKQPVGTFERDSITTQICRENEEIRQALEKRGINIDSVEFGGNNAGDMSIGPNGHREKIVAPEYENEQYGHVPIGGLFAHVDLTNQTVLKIIDKGEGFSGKVDPGYFDPDSLKATLDQPKPVIIEQPDGVNYEIKGHQVKTDHWKFRYGIHNREGLVIYDVQYFDPMKEEWRRIMYRGSIAEMVVNYGSPGLHEATNNFFDMGEFRFFQEENRPLNAGADAPENATYLDAVVHDDKGNPVMMDSTLAVFEEYDGALWRHGQTARRGQNLCIKYFIKAGNYDYGFTWVFKEDGSIQVDNELQGIVHITSVDRTEDEKFRETPYGVLVHPHVEANNHQHWHVWRLDMDVDGTQNTVKEINNIPVPAGPNNPYRNSMVAKATTLKTEEQAKRLQNAETSRRWNVQNTNKETKFGHTPGYVLSPKKGTVPLALKGSSISKRARVLYNHLWVTPHRQDEMYPAGKYPPSDQEFAGLPKWTAKNRNIENRDVVLWYVMGKSHIVRAEDWPIMNRANMAFELEPFNFFDRNPAYGKPPVHDKVLESLEENKPD